MIPPTLRPDVPFIVQTVVVIPALNEAECIAQTVQDWLGLGVGAVRVVDNGSQDDTAARACAAGAQVVHESRRGYGAAAARGLLSFPEYGRWVLFSSADGSDRLTPAELYDWQSAIDAGADLITGDRTRFPASRAHLRIIQRLGNRLCCHAIAWGWHCRFRDLGSLRLIRYTALQALDLQDRGFGWNVEMQVRALEMGFSLVELPVHYFPRRAGDSKISGNLTGTVRAARGILRTLLHLAYLRRTAPTRVAHGCVCPTLHR